MTQTGHAPAMSAPVAGPSKTWPTEQPRSDMRRIIAWGCVLLVLQFCGFGLWATTVPLRGAVVAPGFIKVHSKRKAVQHLEGGIIKSIYVRENDHVEAGQLIARLDTAQIEGSLGSLETKFFADLAMEARLAAEQDAAKSIRFPDELRESATRLSARIAIQTQEAEFAARLAAIENERKVIDQQMLQNADTIRGLQSNTQGLEQQLKLLREEIADTSYLLAKGLARKPRVLALATRRSRGRRTGRSQCRVNFGDAGQDRGVAGQTPAAGVQPKSGYRQAAACDERGDRRPQTSNCRVACPACPV